MIRVIWVGARIEQDPDDLLIAVLDPIHQGCLAIGIFPIEICACIQ